MKNATGKESLRKRLKQFGSGDYRILKAQVQNKHLL